jgi:hypothetical protein
MLTVRNGACALVLAAACALASPASATVMVLTANGTAFNGATTDGATMTWTYDSAITVPTTGFFGGDFDHVDSHNPIQAVSLDVAGSHYSFSPLTPRLELNRDILLSSLTAQAGTDTAASLNLYGVWDLNAATTVTNCPDGCNLSSIFRPVGSGGQLSMHFSSFSIAPAGEAVAAVPEPSTWAMLVLGFGLVGTVTRRRLRKVPAGQVFLDPLGAGADGRHGFA